MCIRPLTREKTVQMEIKPKPVMVRTGQVMISTHQRLVNLAVDSIGNDEHIWMSDLVADDEHQENIDGVPNFEVQDDSIHHHGFSR